MGVPIIGILTLGVCRLSCCMSDLKASASRVDLQRTVLAVERDAGWSLGPFEWLFRDHVWVSELYSLGGPPTL